MNRKWLGLCLLATVVLLASAVWWWLAHDNWQPPAARLPQLPEADALPAPEAVAMREALARPLLWASRRPSDPSLDAAALDPDAEEDAGDLEDATLEAVLESGGQRLALLRTADDKILKIAADPAQAHNAMPNWALEQFDGSTAIFTSADGQRVERTLKPTAAALLEPVATKAETSSRQARREDRTSGNNDLLPLRARTNDDTSDE